MSLFSFLRRKKKSPPAPDKQSGRVLHPAISDDVGALVDDNELFDVPQGLTRSDVTRITGLSVATRASCRPHAFLDADADDAYDVSQIPEPEIVTVSDQLLRWYASHTFPGWAVINTMLQHWMIIRACQMPAQDAMRKGWQLSLPDVPSVIAVPAIKAISRHDEREDVRKFVEDAIYWTRAHGTRHVLFRVQTDDPQYYEMPFNPDSVLPGTYIGMQQIEHCWVSGQPSMAATPDHPRFGMAEYWIVGNRRYHYSHFITLRYSPVPTMLAPRYSYGGISLTQQIYEHVYDAERTSAEAPLLAMTKRTGVHATNASTLLRKGRLAQVAGLFAKMRDNFGTKYINKDETYTQLDTTLTDLDDVITSQQQVVASVAGVPLTRFMGTSPRGFQATGEHEIAAYNTTLGTIQSTLARPILDRHYALLTRSLTPQVCGSQVQVAWNPLDEPTALELAEVQQIRTETLISLQQAGVITSDDVMAALQADPDSLIRHGGIDG